MHKGDAIDRLRGALRASLKEVQKDPSLLGKVVSTICQELGMDPMASVYLAGKVKNMIKLKVDAP